MSPCWQVREKTSFFCHLFSVPYFYPKVTLYTVSMTLHNISHLEFFFLLSKICYLKHVCTVILRGCAFLYDLLLIEDTGEIGRKIPFLNFSYLSKAEHPENTAAISPSLRAFPVGRSVLSRSVDKLSCSKPPSAPRIYLIS